MAYISFQPSDFFNTVLYTGTGASLAITGVGFSPDMTWIKKRSGADGHNIFDTVRGVTKYIAPNDNLAEVTNSNSLTSFDSDGFTVNLAGTTGQSGNTYVGWNWKMGTTSGLTGGTITPSAYSINTTARQSVIAYTGTASTATIPHGLGVKPDLIITKQYNTGRNWSSYRSSLGATKYMTPNSTAASATGTTYWNDTEPDATVFTVGSADETNGSGTMIAYCFADIKGYSKFGSYKGNGNADGQFVYTGFRPAYVIAKNTAGTYNWIVVDDKRSTSGGTNVVDYYLTPNDNSAEGSSGTSRDLDLLSNGFKFRGDGSEFNGAGVNYIYAAFAEFPLVSSNDVPGVAR